LKKRKILSLLCAGAVALTALAGCQSGNAQSAASGAQNASASKEAPTLTWWLIGSQPENLQDGLDKINAYTTDKINVKVDIKMSGYGEWSDKMNQVVNSGEKFDIMFTNDSKYRRQIDQGALADITDMVKKETPDLYKFIPEMVWEGATVNGKIYSVPTYKDSSMTQYWVFDDTYVKKYNIDISNIKTFEALDPALTKMKKGEGKSFYPMPLESGGFNGLLNNYDGLTLGLPPIGVRIDDKDHKVVSVLEQQDTMANLNMLHKWYKEGIINPDAATQTETAKGRPFFAAQGFPGAEASWQVNEGVAKYDMVQVADSLYTNGTIQGSLNAISANSEHKAEALKLLQLVNTDQKLRDMLSYGVEGTDFEYKSPKVVKRLTDTWQIGNYAIGTFFDMSTVDGAPEDQWEQVKKLNENATSSICLGFTPDISKLGSEIANCQATWDKYSKELLTGASDPTTMVPKITSELKAAGMDKIVTEIQSQLDAQFKK
jgi:putative aldouronate transport system substrate-binding protein